VTDSDDLLVRLTEALPAWLDGVQLVVVEEEGPATLTIAGQEVLRDVLPAVAKWSGEVYCRALTEAAAWLELAGTPGGPPSRASNGGYLYADDGTWAPGVLRDLATAIAARQQF
jgi:hypothetical protein